jgi:hypothetical protein
MAVSRFVSVRLGWLSVSEKRHGHAVYRAAAAGEFVECRVVNGHALGAQRGVQALRMGGGDDSVIAK